VNLIENRYFFSSPVVNPFFFLSRPSNPKPLTTASDEFPFAIRTAKSKEIGAISDILAESFHSRQGLMSWTYPFMRLGIYEDLRTRIRSGEKYYICLVAFSARAGEEELLAGTVEMGVRSLAPSWMMDNFEYAYLSNLAVSPKYRRQGVAEQLLISCEEVALKWGFNDLYLHVLENNSPAKNLYKKAGYRLKDTESNWGSLLFGKPRKLFLRKRIRANG